MARTSKLSGSLLARKDTGLGMVSAPFANAETVAIVGEGGKPIALTLKVDQARYEALKTLGARTRRSNQEILLAALDAYLRAGEG